MIDTIINGDALETLKALPDNYIDLVVTDIPYKIKVKQSAGAFGVKKKMHYKNDLLEISEGIPDEVLKELCRVMKKINIYIFCSKEQIPQMLNFFLPKKCNWQILTWHKTNPIPSCGNSYMPDTEYCLFFRDKGVFVGGSPNTKMTYYTTKTNKEDKKKYGHPTVKPLFIIKNLIINSSGEGDIVLDPYVGSGTSAVAAKELKRHYIGINNNAKHYSTARTRLNTEQQNLFAKTLTESGF